MFFVIFFCSVRTHVHIVCSYALSRDFPLGFEVSCVQVERCQPLCHAPLAAYLLALAFLPLQCLF